LEEQIDRIYAERVPLKSGGTIVINPTEALVSIDVNSGRSTGQKEIEDTAHRTNLEAAEEVARQLRLRDLGGLIVIDFIDMKERKHQKEVEQTLKQSLKKDKARVTVGPLSKFGLLELSRQRLRPTAEVSAYVVCPTCRGLGRIKKVDTLSVNLLRQISTQVAQSQVQEVRALVPAEVGHFLLNKKRKDLLDLEEQYNIKIVVTGKENLGPEEIQVEYLKRGEAAEAKAAPERKAPAEAKRAPEAKTEEKPAAEIKEAPEPTASPGAKKPAAAKKRPSRPRRRSSKPKAKAESAPESPEAPPAPEPGATPEEPKLE
jgi:ribonuclease E